MKMYISIPSHVAELSLLLMCFKICLGMLKELDGEYKDISTFSIQTSETYHGKP